MLFHMLAAYSWGQFLTGALLIGVCLLLMLIILLQKGRGEGLAGAFGGGGGSSAFGAKTGDVFTWITVSLAAVFIFLSVIANFVFDESAAAASNVATVTTEPEPAIPEQDSSVPIPQTPPTPVTIPTTRVVIPPSGSDADGTADTGAIEKPGKDATPSADGGAPAKEAPAGNTPETDKKESPPNP